MTRLIIIAAFVLLMTSIGFSQGFSSGSTGADGPLDLVAMSCTNNCIVQLPESGILNYTTVNIPAGKFLSFKRNTRNTPVIMLAQGSVVIDGGIGVMAYTGGNCWNGSFHDCRFGGPGGFSGGDPGQLGFGPGGGQPGTVCDSYASTDSKNSSGRWVGPLSLVPIVGGSGGGGTACPGGPGGGAIVIASSASITMSNGAYIDARGGLRFPQGFQGSSGSGGAIRLVANLLSIAGSFNACEFEASSTPSDKCGVVRLEAPTNKVTFTGSSNPPAVISDINPIILPTITPNLSIAKIGGYAVPPYSGTRFNTVDLLLPNQLTDPISVVVQGSNIPVGTQVNINFSGSPSAIFTSGTLQGTLQSSTATLTVSNLTRTEVTYLFVYATFDLPMTSQIHNSKGKDQVAKVRLESAPGEKPKFVFLRKDGSEIDSNKLPDAFLKEFGMR